MFNKKVHLLLKRNYDVTKMHGTMIKTKKKRRYIKLPLGLQRRMENYQNRTLELFGNTMNRRKCFCSKPFGRERRRNQQRYLQEIQNFKLLFI